MIRIGQYIITTRSEFASTCVRLMPVAIQEGARHAADLVNADLLRACMAADAHLHEDPTAPAHELHRQAVRELIAAAIAPALAQHGG